MENFHAVKIGVIGRGLTNQLGALISGIMYAKMAKKRFVLAGKFNKNYNMASHIPIGDVIDLNTFNKNISDIGVTVLDIHDTTLKIISIRYGLYMKSIDITREILSKYYVNGKLSIPKGIILNDIKGDPEPFVKKYLFIKYEIGGYSDNAMYDENFNQDIDLDLSKIPTDDHFHSHWITTYDIDLYDKILRAIKFTSQFYDVVDASMQDMNLTAKVNVIHIRTDKDATTFWGCLNNIPTFEFGNILNAKYISLIQKYFDKSISILVLTSDTESQVIQFLRDNGYKFHIAHKSMTDGREMNAIVDVLIGEHCNNIFIGGVNPENYHGSTFSYLVWKRLAKNVSNVLIDLDDIKRNEFIVKS
jgi:hypothetical protein